MYSQVINQASLDCHLITIKSIQRKQYEARTGDCGVPYLGIFSLNGFPLPQVFSTTDSLNSSKPKINFQPNAAAKCQRERTLAGPAISSFHESIPKNGEWWSWF